ncbi:MAG: glyceraldehyde-3-phosphate dehydrogenase [Thermodesulfovibrionales bacterium]|nr:glyceraldehyde-3-phosphate dehydrogenase [Thermodesulfovibrionales bacterium]
MSSNKYILGINGLGRIGKLTLWNQVGRKFFSEIVINIGRNAGTKLEDIAYYIEKDSTYGSINRYLYGHKSKRLISDIDEKKNSFKIDGIPVTILKETRNPANIDWEAYGVNYVLDATGKFLDPSIPSDAKNGSLRGHLKGSVKKVIVSAPYKIKDKNLPWPEDSITIVMGVNENEYDPSKHNFISAASCTTTCLSHMLKPLLKALGSENVLGVTMCTIHAMTGSQQILDRLPKEGADDLRKNRSVMNNIILTSTGVSKTLHLIIPEMKNIGFIAESIRVPITTGSLIVLVVTFNNNKIDYTKEMINDIYRKYANVANNNYILYTEEQNVSSDIVGLLGPAVVIEGHDTYTLNSHTGVSQAVIHGWYDNEMGSFTNVLSDLILKIATS